MEENEEWKDITGYEGLYQVSNFGKVKSLNYRRTGKECLLSVTTNNFGYSCVYLNKNGKRNGYYLHRLVAEAFLSNPMLLPEVNHKDENPLNNNVENLEWCTHVYNMNYGTVINRVKNKLKKSGHYKYLNSIVTNKLSKKVYQYDLNNNLIKIWDSTNECGRNGYGQSSVSACCRGKQKQAYGYKWFYNPLN